MKDKTGQNAFGTADSELGQHCRLGALQKPSDTSDTRQRTKRRRSETARRKCMSAAVIDEATADGRSAGAPASRSACEGVAETPAAYQPS